MHPKDRSILDFNYDLPASKIASYPLEQRDASKLLVYGAGVHDAGAHNFGTGAAQISETTYSRLDEVLPSNTLLIHNDTKVVAARLFFEKENGSTIEIFCLEPASIYKDITSAMLAKKQVLWGCLIGGAKKWKEGPLHIKYGNNHTLTATKHTTLADSYLIQFEWDNDAQSFAEVLEAAGNIPLPPYFNRAVEANDKERYQTVYAAAEGSVAAPTAGLHFDELVFKSLSAKGIDKKFITLHVGAGTFMPVKVDDFHDHLMHAEFIDIDLQTIEYLATTSHNVIAVGTTSLRTLESLYWLAIKIKHQPDIDINEIKLLQWDAYTLDGKDASMNEAMQFLKEWMTQKKINTLFATTQLMVKPGYQFKICKGLITNFHQPKSTLLLIIAAIAGDQWKSVYQHALANEYRFLSYGDGCLFWFNHR